MRKLHLILLGLPNGGKGTLTRQLLSIFGKNGSIVTVIPMSSILKKEAPETVKWMDAGEMVPDEIVIPLAIQAIQQAEGNVLIYDGFPRRQTQVEAFLEAVQGEDVMILELNTPKEVALKRAENRLVCSKCDTSWAKKGEMAPARPGKCDKCGGKLVRRKDDAIIEKRIKMYGEYMIPAADSMKEIGIPFKILDYRLTEEEDIKKCLFY